jgi:4-alpha-glucanotransferase
MIKNLLNQRVSGVILHPTSLPGKTLCGELGNEAYAFVDALAAAGQRLWAILPLGPTFEDVYHCPYSSYSGFAGNPVLISLADFYESGILKKANSKAKLRAHKDRADLAQAHKAKEILLKQVFDKLHATSWYSRVNKFSAEHDFWLDDFSLFTAIRKKKGVPRTSFGTGLTTISPQAKSRYRNELSEQIEFEKFCQYLFFYQWQELKRYANKKGVAIVGDMPIYVSDDSADVWSRPELFQLDLKTGRPKLVSGVPPDSFSKTGQLWNHPVYNWKEMEKTKFLWWIERMRVLSKLVNFVRIDHFRGFVGFWAVKGGSKTAQHGRWYPCPGDQLFSTMKRALGELPIIVEDLGHLTDDVHALREKFSFMGMKILQAGFDGPGRLSHNPYVPFNYVQHTVVYPGTHDNPTACDFLQQLPKDLQKRVLEYIGSDSREHFHWNFIRVASSSPSKWCITPMQDVLGLGSDARMNMPGIQSWKNWTWRMDNFDKKQIRKLREITAVYDRLGN